MLRSFKVSILFLVICAVWLLFSDQILAYYLGSLTPVQQREYDFGFVGLLAITLFFLFKERDSLQVSVNKQYRQLFELNPNPSWIYNNDTLRFIKVNDAAIEQCGYNKDEFMNMTIADIHPNDERERLDSLLREDYHFGLTGQWKHCKANGSVIEVLVSSYPVIFDHQPCSMVTATDITELLQKERQLQGAYQKVKNFNEPLGNAS